MSVGGGLVVLALLNGVAGGVGSIPAKAATKAASTGAGSPSIASVGAVCSKVAKAIDDAGRALTCASTAVGRVWVWASPIPSPVDETAPVPLSWAAIGATASGANADVPSPALPGIYANRAAMEARLVDIFNSERASRGLRPLAVDPRLTRLTRWWAEHTTDSEFAGRGTSHCPANLCGVRAAELGYPSFGEVIRAWNPFPAADLANERFFVDSSRHMAILNNPKVTHIGFGVFITGEPGSPQSVAVVGQVGRSR